MSFYTMFYTRPVGKFVLQVCRTLSCALNGAERVTEELRGKLGIKPGETDATGTFTLLEVECLGACDRAPVVMVNDAWHECLRPEDVERLVDDLRARGEAALTRLSSRRREEHEHEARSTKAAWQDTRVLVMRWPDAWNRSSPNTSASRTASRSTSISQHEGYDGAEEGARA